MGSHPYELDTKPEPNLSLSTPLQDEANKLRDRQTNSGGITTTFEHAVESVPAPVAAVASFTSGVLSRFPGGLGVTGKVVGTAIGLAYGSDLALRLGDSSSSSNSGRAVRNDAIVLGTLGLGFLSGSKVSSVFKDSSAATDALALPKFSDKTAIDWTKVPSWAEGTRYPAIRENFLEGINTYSREDQDKIRQALNVAEDAHLGQLRQVHIDRPDLQDPFIIHPVRTAQILMNEAGVTDADSISAALLHDVVEDSGGRYTVQGITNQFGSKVGTTVDYVTKPPKIGGIKPDLAPYYARLESAPPEIRNIKLADRLDNIRDTALLPNPEFQARKLQETIDHYLPMADNTSQFFSDQLNKSTDELTKLLAQKI